MVTRGVGGSWGDTAFDTLRSVTTDACIKFIKGIRMSTSNQRSTDEAQIRDLVESWASAVRTRNLDGIMANHSPEILMFDVPPPEQSKGIEAYRKTWEVFFAWFQDSGIFDVRELNITAGDDVAFGTALMRCGGTEANGDKVKIDFRLTICFRKIDGRWTVMHEHHSIPVS